MFQDLVIRCEEAKRHRSKASIEKKYSPLSEEGEKYVGCTPHPVLCTTFSHTVEKEEIDASPFTLHLSLKKRAAFTLAEVLITLGIIGVVAAMTMPSLINKYQMKSYEVAFKKQYSVLQNAINYLVLDSNISACYIFYPIGQISYSMVKDDCQALQDSLVSQLNLTKIPRDPDYTFAKKTDVLANGGKTVNINCSYDAAAQGSPIYSTKDGAIIIFTDIGTSNQPFIIIDVNGKKGPNKWGYDVFFMTLSKKDRNDSSTEERIFLTDEYCSIVEKGGRLPRTILQNKEKTEDSDFNILWD